MLVVKLVTVEYHTILILTSYNEGDEEGKVKDLNNHLTLNYIETLPFKFHSLLENKILKLN